MGDCRSCRADVYDGVDQSDLASLCEGCCVNRRRQ